MALEEILARCIEKWRGAGIALSPPVEEAEVRRVWDGFGKHVSEDVVRLYATFGGFQEYVDDGGTFFWFLWPWEMVCQENTDERVEGVMFCDHSIRVVTWELRFEDERQSSVWTTDHNSMSAPSLESFFRLYLEDPWELL